MELHQPSGRWRLGLGLSLLTALMWGILPIALEITLEQMDAFTITWYRFLIAGLLLGSSLALRKGLPRVQGQSTGVYLLLALVTLSLGSNYVLYLLGLSRTSAGAAQVLIQLAPAMAMLGSLIFFRERFEKGQWLGLVLLCGGMLMFFHNRLGDTFLRLGEYSLGMILIFFAAITWAIYALAQKQLLSTMSSAQVLLLVYVGSMLFLLPTAHPRAILRLDTLHLCLLAFCALNTVIAYGSFSEALDHWESSRVNAVLAITPITTLAMLWLGSRLWPYAVNCERITPLSGTGAALVVAGSMMIALGSPGRG